MTPLLSVEDARAAILKNAQAIQDIETVSLDQAIGRKLAEDIVATRSQPPFAASAMDGYAVRSADLKPLPRTLKITGYAPAGHGYDGTVGPGEAVRVFTGAPVPAGADTIVIQEDTERMGENAVRIGVGAPEGQYIRFEGLDFAAGDTVLRTGQKLDAGRLTVAAAMNCPQLPVRRRPHVAVLATGDELVAPGSIPGPDQIIASNGYGVRAFAEICGATVTDLGIAADHLDVIDAAVEAALDAKADILVTLGGASVGDHDLVQQALIARGMDLEFWRIAMRPGKPLMCGRLDSRHVLGLPGNPVSSLVCSHLFLRPLIDKLAGDAETDRHRDAVLGCDLPENDRREDYLRARLERDPNGRLVATPFQKQDSSMTRTFADSDCLVIRAPHAEAAKAGSACCILLLREPPQ
ncbi:MAG: gephyrin-like molybdotransferase Glp [Pseudomonadota bacterium]